MMLKDTLNKRFHLHRLPKLVRLNFKTFFVYHKHISLIEIKVNRKEFKKRTYKNNLSEKSRHSDKSYRKPLEIISRGDEFSKLAKTPILK